MENKIVMGHWDCPFCGHKKIQGTVRVCSDCGNPRGSETKFYMDSSDVEYLSEEASRDKGKGADWLCPYCDKLNPISVTSCIGCGALREESEQDYFSMQKEEPQTREPESPPPEQKAKPAKGKKSTSALRWMGRGEVILAVLLCVVAFFVPKNKTFHCTDVFWENVINVEAYETVEESDWNLPSGGFWRKGKRFEATLMYWIITKK